MTDELNVLTDDLNLSLKEFEDAVYARGLGVPASVSMSEGEKLTYGKMGTQWRLIFETESGEPVPLLNASRGIRVQAVAYLPALLTALDEAYQQTLQDVHIATSNVRRLTKAIQEK